LSNEQEADDLQEGSDGGDDYAAWRLLIIGYPRIRIKT
jgi:hypothetical protein